MVGLPPLNAVRVFEVAARLASFNRAAEELQVIHRATRFDQSHTRPAASWSADAGECGG